MSGIKGMKRYSQEIKEKIYTEYKNGTSQYEISKKYNVSRYSVQSWCGLRPETEVRQIAPLPKGRPKKVKNIEDYKKENKRLKMENDLMRDFLSLTERK